MEREGNASYKNSPHIKKFSSAQTKYIIFRETVQFSSSNKKIYSKKVVSNSVKFGNKNKIQQPSKRGTSSILSKDLVHYK